MSYKCICGKEFKASLTLKNHKKECVEIQQAVENAPFCYCGDKLGFKIHNGILQYQTNCGKHECRGKHVSKKFKNVKWSKERKENAFKIGLWMNDKIKVEGEFKCDRCDKTFKSNTSLRAHKASCGYYNEKSFICPDCGRAFRKESGLAVHHLAKHDESERGKNHRKHLIEMGNNMANKSKQRAVSNLEKYFEKEFLINIKDVIKKLNRQFRLKALNTLYFYDFYIKELNLIIEVDGDYWHINPKRFKFEDMPLHVQQYKEREKEKYAWAIKHNYNVIRFWEDDIKNNPDFIKEELNKWFKNLN
jgi:very-short-patch-repair endonuclease/transposase-like protein